MLNDSQNVADIIDFVTTKMGTKDRIQYVINRINTLNNIEQTREESVSGRVFFLDTLLNEARARGVSQEWLDGKEKTVLGVLEPSARDEYEQQFACETLDDILADFIKRLSSAIDAYRRADEAYMEHINEIRARARGQ